MIFVRLLCLSCVVVSSAVMAQSDDMPDISAENLTISLSENDFIDGRLEVSSQVHVDFGNDGPGTITPTGQVLSFCPVNGVTDLSSGGDAITITTTSDGYSLSANGVEVVSFVVNPTTFIYTVIFSAELDHDLTAVAPEELCIFFGVRVTDSDGDNALANVRIILTEGTSAADGTDQFSWSQSGNINDQWLYLGSQPGKNDYLDSGMLPGTTRFYSAVDLPMDGTNIYVKLWYRNVGDPVWYFHETIYKAFGITPTFTAPAPGDPLNGAVQSFSWVDNGASLSFWLDVGSDVGLNDYFNSGSLGAANTVTAAGLPTDGESLVYVRLWYQVPSGTWLFIDEVYIAGSSGTPKPLMTSPSSSIFAGANETFSWNENDSGATQYWAYWGSTQGGSQYGNENVGVNLSATNTTLPTNASTVWFRLWYRATSTSAWQFVDTSYTASGSGPSITSHSSGDVLNSPADTFTWSDPSGAVTQWWVYVGSSSGGQEHDNSGNLGPLTTYESTALPDGGEHVFFRLWYRIGNDAWQYIDHVFSAAL